MVKAIGILCALFLHAGFLLFGGLLLPEPPPPVLHYQQVDLLDPEAPKEEKPPEPEPKPLDANKPPEEAPDAAQLAKSLDAPSLDDAPALDAASLAALGDALSGQAGGGGDFGNLVGFGSGGRIGGTGTAGGLADAAAGAFSLADIDQKPRAVYQADPTYPAAMRGKRVEGVVSVLFVVDADGKVAEPRVEKANDPGFEKAALDAVRRWRFEPGVRGGKRVACKMRVSIRFPAANRS